MRRVWLEQRSGRSVARFSNPPAGPSLGACAALLLLSGACRHSTVWLGRAEGAGGSATPAADGGRPEAPDAEVGAPGDTVDAGLEAGAGDPLPPRAGSSPMSQVAGASGGLPAARLEPALPGPHVACPPIESGTQMFDGVEVQLWIGGQVGGTVPARGAPLLIYWHGTGSNSGEAANFSTPGFEGVLAEGGIVAAPSTSRMMGRATHADMTWSTADFDVADAIVVCTSQQHPIDPRRIYTAGCGSGGVHAGVMAFERSRYIAAAATNSGGLTTHLPQLQAATLPAPVIAAHGPAGDDVIGLDFATASEDLVRAVSHAGGFAVICAHDGGHCGAPAEVTAAQWDFLQVHSYGVSPSPYSTSGLPSSFPESCTIATQ